MYAEGAYADAVKRFSALLRYRNDLDGYPIKTCAFWRQHALACEGYHNQRARAGIPEPPRLDPLCGAAALAASLSSLGLPADKPHVLANCRVTGEGSSLEDLCAAASKLGAHSYVVNATEQALRQLPKPLVFHAEHDHFLSLVRADNKGVSYLCSDCGAWPGGRVNLSWKAFRMLDASVFLVVTRPGSLWDTRLGQMKLAAAHPEKPMRLASSRLSSTLARLLPFKMLGLTVLQTVPSFFTCGNKNSAQQCPPMTSCPTDGGFCAALEGPSAGDPVNLATGEEEYSPKPDLVVYNPNGPNVVWARIYNSLRGTDSKPYEYDDFGVGWSQGYNVGVYDPSSTPGNLVSGTLAPKYVVYPNGSKVAFTAPSVPSNQYPPVPVNCQVPPGAGFQVQWYASASNDWYVVTFKNRSQWVTTNAIQNGTPTIGNHQFGLYFHQLLQVIDSTGHALGFNYQSYPGTANNPSESGYWLLSSITGNGSPSNPGGNILLTINRSTAPGYVGQITSVTDLYNRSIYYTVDYLQGANASVPELLSVNRISNPYIHHYEYGYINSGNRGESAQYLSTISTLDFPDPKKSNGAATATINYDPTNLTVSSRIDANGNRRSYTAGPTPNSARVLIISSDNGFGSFSYTLTFDSAMRQLTRTNGDGAIVESNTYADPNDPWMPSSVLSGTAIYDVPLNDGSGLPSYGSDAPYTYAWEIWWFNTLVDHSASGGNAGVNGWGVSSNNGVNPGATLWVIAPTTASVGPHYEVRYGTPRSVGISAYFDVTHMRRNGTSFKWDALGNLQAYTSPRGTTATFQYQYTSAPPGAINPITGGSFALGELIRSQEGTKTASTFVWNETVGMLASVSTPLPGTVGTGATVTSSWTYDALGNVTASTVPGNYSASQATTTYTYTDQSHPDPQRGEPLTITDASLVKMNYAYSSAGWVARTTDAIGNFTSFDRNFTDGRPTVIATGGPNYQTAKTTLTYKSGDSGPLIKVETSAGSTIAQQSFPQYGLEGEAQGSTNSWGVKQYSILYDCLYRPFYLNGPNGETTIYNYDQAGNLTQVQYPNWTIQYPAYSVDGMPEQRIDGRGQITYYGYDDPMGSLTDISYTATPALNAHAVYDGYSRMTSLTDGAGARTVSYDDQDTATGVTTTYSGLPANSINYSYWPDGSRKFMYTPVGTYQYTHFADGLPYQVADPFNNLWTYSYNANGQLNSQKYTRGASTTSTATTNYYYSADARGLLTGLVNSGGPSSQYGQSPTSGSPITYDGAGSVLLLPATIAAAPTLSGTTNYLYDGEGQLLTESNTGSTAHNWYFDGHDASNNPTTYGDPSFIRGVGGYTYNASNQLTNTGFVYDANGNPTTYNNNPITWDVENRATNIANGALQSGYNAEGMRAWKYNASGQVTYFLYDGDVPVCELNASGQVKAANTFGPTGLMARVGDPTYSTVIYTWDPFGNLAQASTPTGQVIVSAKTDAFGAVQKVGSYSDPYCGFGGQFGNYTDPETQTVLMGKRMYDSGHARFLNPDPIGYGGGLNLYAYAGNNGPNSVDPSGLSPSSRDIDYETVDDSALGSDLTTRDPNFMRAGFKFGENLSGALWPVNLATGLLGKSVYGCDINTQTRLYNFGFGMLGAAGAMSSIAEESSAFKAAKPDGCFVAGTPVAVSNDGPVVADAGTSSVHYKAIEDIHVDDVVVSRNIQTGKTENKKVVKVHKHVDHETITVALADPSGKVVEHITATTEHPFYVEGRGMVALSQLGIGTQIVTRAGPALTVKSAIHENHSHGVLVYNFEVEGDHTYFVGTANGGAWVHNDSTLFHYTTEEGMSGIVDSEELKPSLKEVNPADARYGNGQYLSDIPPGTKSPSQLSRAFINNPFQGKRFTHFVGINVEGLQVVKGREGVFVVPGETPLGLTGRIVSHGPVP